MPDLTFPTAHHEAGHAVVARLFGGEIAEIWIDPKDGGGETKIGWPDNKPSTDEKIMVALASDACLRAFAINPAHELHFWEDATQVDGLLEELFPGDEKAQNAHHDQLDRLTAALFERPDVRAAAEAVVRKLIVAFRIASEEANRLIDSYLTQ